MALLTSLLSMMDSRTVGGIAGALGESQQSVSRGLQSSIATVLGGLASKSGDTATLAKVMDLAPTASGDGLMSQIASGVSDPNSPLISGGRRLLSTLFGGSERAITSAVSGESGLSAGVIGTLLSVAAPMVASFIGKRVRDEGMSMTDLGGFLQRETASIRGALPAGVSDLLWPRAAAAAPAAFPVVAQAVEREGSSYRWVLPLLCLALIPGLFWIFGHHRTVPVTSTPIPTGTANRMAPDMSIPARRLAENYDLRFETGTTRLTPESQRQLNRMTADLAAYPTARVQVGGYTDSTGSANQNLQLSRRRADRIVADLVRSGVSANRVTAEGFGEANPIADNATVQGRAMNRRVNVSAMQ